MTLDQFVRINQLRPADAIMLNKKIFGMLDHYVIYLGIRNGRHVFVANYSKGVSIISDQELQGFLQVLVPKQIHRFRGDAVSRIEAVNRAWNRIGERAYSYLENNCEHFKNYVQTGVARSVQSENFKNGVKTTAGIAAGVALLALIFGGSNRD